jgi:large subunit ribosomal protein L35
VARLDMPWRLLIATARARLHPSPYGHKRKSEMSKMKTKSGAKKRFKITANGKIKTHQVGKRHRLINNSPARTRDLRGMDTLSKSETRRVNRWMPYGGGI